MSILDRFSLDGRVAVVSGPGQGIGRAIALAMAEAGADVVLAGINVENPAASEAELAEAVAQIEERGRRALPVTVDMRDAEGVQGLVAKAVEAFGKVDVMVNNVGGTGLEPTLGLSEETWNLGIETNLTTTFMGCRYAGEHMAERGSGAIVNISSMDGRRPALHRAAYGAGKAGVISLTETAAEELGPYGIRVNAIAPTWVLTERMAQRWEEDPSKPALAVPTIPLGRGARPDEVAALAVFLASDASSYITGHTIGITGGALITGTPEMIV